MSSPPEDRCPSCNDRPTLMYRYKGIALYPCERHWDMHCSSIVPYSLKKVAERYMGEDNG